MHMVALRRHAKGAYSVWWRDVLRFTREPARIVTALAQPVLFLFVLGTGLARPMSDMAEGVIDFRHFMFPGMLAMPVLFASTFSALSIVWDREFGFLKSVLVSPASRTAVAIGKVAGGSTIATLQGSLVLLLAPFVNINLTLYQIVSLVGLMILLAAVMSALGIVVAARQRSMEGFQVVMQFLLMPMFFLSGALFVLTDAPPWLLALSRIDPVTYGVDALRQVALRQSISPEDLAAVTLHSISFDIAVMFALAIAFLAPAVWLFRRPS